MTTINTIEDLARILRDQPTWAEALRALLLTQELLDLPGPVRPLRRGTARIQSGPAGDQPADRPAAQRHRRGGWTESKDN